MPHVHAPDAPCRSATGRGRRAGRAAALGGLTAAALVAAVAGVASAHDFWLVPNAFAIAAGEVLTARGQTSTRFPTSVAAVAAERVAEARLVGADEDTRVTDLAVADRSLVLRARPTRAGQRVLAVALVPRVTRTTASALQRYLALEGAPALAERYAREGRLTSGDTIEQRTTKLAKTVVQVGRDGPRAFSRSVGHALEFVPLTDPTAARAGDTLVVRLLFRGAPLGGAQLHAGMVPPPSGSSAAADSVAAAAAPPDMVLTTDAQGLVRLPLTRGGLWNVRTVHAAPAAAGDGAAGDGAAGDGAAGTGAGPAGARESAGAANGGWDVYFATLVLATREVPTTR